uniref:Poly A polymerase head domain-containing protein n=1 Tax=Plectus sambesii TaxID=2011161 RepID=A0A914VDB5_9BILA
MNESHLLRILLCLFFIPASARITILIESSQPALRARRQSPSPAAVILPEACKNVEKVDKKSLTFSRGFESVSVPWMRKDLSPMLMTNDALKRNWEKLIDLKVRGMNATVKEVIAHLRDNGCLFMPWGGAIRDMVLDRPPHDVDAEVSCSQQRVLSLCSDKFGKDNCEKSPRSDSTKLRIGNDHHQRSSGSGTTNQVEPMDVVQWKETFEVPPVEWEYTPNSLSYYAMPHNSRQALIDLTGEGFKDVCEKKIRIPAAKPDWPRWVGKGLNKRLRFWKLRINGYDARDNETKTFIIESLKKDFTKSDMQKFYCIYVMFGVFNESQSTCALTDAHAKEVVDSKRAFNAAFEKDLGASFWQKTMKPAIDSLALKSPSAKKTTTKD